MAMLAEPRRKQKYSINPRGTIWSNDENKFGQKLLEKMGWSKGKGLGSQENGRTEHVGIKLKVDKKGVGCTNKFADKWIEHQDDFNDLLTCLNQEQNNSDNGKELEKKHVVSLEKKSEKSRSRVHYMKFTKGKDLSSRSKQDLDCIFGKRKTKKADNKKVEEEVEEVTVTEKDTVNHDHGVKTITNSVSIHEYFALKMKQKRQSLLELSDNSNQSTPSSEETCELPDEKTATNMKRKNVSFCKEFQYKYLEDDSPENSEKSECKKMKMCVDSEDIYQDNGVGQDMNDRSAKKKSKKKKEKLRRGDMPVIEETDFTIKFHKKKLEKDERTDVDIEEEEPTTTVTKKSKKREKLKENQDDPLMEKMKGNEDIGKFAKTKKKSKKRRKEEDKEDIFDENNTCSEHCYKQQDKNEVLQVESNIDLLVKKKKNKKRKKVLEDEMEVERNRETKEKVAKTKKKKTEDHKDTGIKECDHVSDNEREVVHREYHAIDQAKLTSDQVKTICMSFLGSNIENIVGYLNSGPVVTNFYS